MQEVPVDEPAETTESNEERAAVDPTTGMPRWVKASLIAAAVIVVMVVVMLLVGGEHSPGRHT